LEQAADIGVVAGDDVGVQVGRYLGDDGVDLVTGCGPAHKGAGRVSSLFGQGKNLTSAQEPTELDLGGGAAGLGDDRRRNDGYDRGFEPDPMISPDGADVAVGSDQDAGVVDDWGRAVRRSPEMPTRRRAASSSSLVRGPLSASHSETAARPDRTRSARRAAAVIHAETLTPSAESSPSCPSALYPQASTWPKSR
jgi:hypothetical protein